MRVKTAEEVILPYVPVIVTSDVPRGAALPAVSVNRLFPVEGLGEKLALTPPGKPEMPRATGLVNPKFEFTNTYVALDVPAPILTSPGCETVKVGANTVRSIVVVELIFPEVARTVTANGPVAAVLLAVSVNVLYTLQKVGERVTGFGEKEAVTPLGKPETDRLTSPLNPFWPEMSSIVELVAP